MYQYRYDNYNFNFTLPKTFPPQHQDQKPGIESIMMPVPISDDPSYIGSNKLKDKVAIITGGDSGIGRAVSIAFAKEGANLAIVYLSPREDQDARDTQEMAERYGARVLLIRGNLTNEDFCKKVVDDTIKQYGKLDILVNNAGTSYINNDITTLTEDQITTTFKTNIFSQIYMSKVAVKRMERGASIVNTASITAFEAEGSLVDYSATKGAVVAFTRTLSKQLVKKGIRVNAVAPTYTWTPLIPSTMSEYDIINFGTQSLIGRAAQPFELAPAYVYLASNISSGYITGKILQF